MRPWPNRAGARSSPRWPRPVYARAKPSHFDRTTSASASRRSPSSAPSATAASRPRRPTSAGRFDLSPDLARTLHRHLVWLKEEALRCGWGEPEVLFPNDRGRVQDKWVAGKAFRRMLKKAKLPAFGLYDLRHPFASLLLAAGAPITYVSAQLGHATPTTTLRFYAKWIPSKGRRWVEVLDGRRCGQRSILE